MSTTPYYLSLLGMSLGTSFSYGQISQPGPLPNIVLIFADDVGYGDVGCYGATGFTTPNLDKLACEGIRFTNFYAAQAVSSASRAALLTGCYPNRIGITGALMPWSRIGINPEETTLPEMLKPKGYATAIYGKWHLGGQPEFNPLKHGFDEYFGLLHSNDMWPIGYDGKPITDSADHKINYPPLILMEDNKALRELKSKEDLEPLTTLYTEKAVSFIHRHKNKPFFLYLPHSMAHVPLAVSEKFKGKSEQGMYGDVMMEMDWSVGQIMQALQEDGLAENTIVIFTSDNGPWLSFGNHGGSAGGLREGKGCSFEGGQREPCIVRWPAVVPSGQVISQMASTIDLLPTLAHFTGAQLPEKKIDGVDISSLWKGDVKAEPRRVFYYYYGRNNLEAVRMDHWKVVYPHTYESYLGITHGKDGFPGEKMIHKADYALYNLQNDPGERYNVLHEYPEIANEIHALADLAREDIGDALMGMPGKNNREPGRIRVDPSLFSRSVRHKALGLPVMRQYPDGTRNHLDSNSVLTDGFRLTTIDENNEWRYWQGFEGDDMDVVIDLGKNQKIDSVSVNFLQEHRSWIFRPNKVICMISSDGKEYRTSGEMLTKMPMDRSKKCMEGFAFPINAKTRYIRLKAMNVGTCPDWHPGKGQRAWLFADEIVVR